MNTLQTNGSFTMVKKYLKEGGIILENKINDSIIKEYINYLLNLGVQENTIIRKLGATYLFLKYIDYNNFKVKSISKEIVYDYLNVLSKMNWKLTYLDRNKFDLKIFLNWLFENKKTKIPGDLILPRIKWHERTNIKSYYTKDEINALINAIDTKTNKGKEDFLIISIICYLGLRISDVINLKLNNIDFNNNIISIIQYKTKEKLVLPLIDEIRYPLIDYLKNIRPTDADIDFIFITNEKPYKQKNSLKRESRKIKKYLTKAGVNINGRKHGFHSLRFSFSTMLLSKDVDLYSISTILGHQDIKTTMSYLDIDILKLKELALEVPYVK